MVRHWPLFAVLALLLAFLPPAFAAATATAERSASPPAPAQTQINRGVQDILDRHGSVLRDMKFGKYSAAEIIEGYSGYYSLNPRIIVGLLELVSGLVTGSQADQAVLQQPLGSAGPAGFERQIEWAVRELRIGLGPFEVAPVASFVDGSSVTLSLEQDAEMLAVQIFLAKGRTQDEWRVLMQRYATVYDQLFAAEPAPPVATPLASEPFLSDPWPAGTRVIHSSWFDHAFPMVDVGGDGNETMVDYFGRGGLSYNGHDGHDFYFPDMPYGTPMLAAAPGWAYARTTRGNGVVIRHTGAWEGYETVYWHLHDFAPEFRGIIDSNEPIWVERGAFLGWSGSSGFTNGAPHLHFEVRHNGKQIDPFGWFGPGEDPCLQYPACGRSVWLWDSSSIWQRPDRLASEDKRPPTGLLTVNPDPDLLLAASFDQAMLPDVGSGMAHIQGAILEEGRFGQAVRVTPESSLSYPISTNLDLEQGTLAFWTLVPEQYPFSSTGRNYLIAGSDHPDDPAGIYSDTLALRYESGSNSRASRWSFWTVSGEGRSHNLSVINHLEPGWHHFALTWERESGTKKLYINGRLVALSSGAALPDRLTGRLELGRWYLGSGVSDVRFDDLAIWHSVLSDGRIATLAASEAPLQISTELLTGRSLSLLTPAHDDGGGIVQVQLGIDGRFSAPLPYYSGYHWNLPEQEGRHEIAVRYADRAGNTTTVTRSVELNYSPSGSARLLESSALTTTVAFSTAGDEPLEVLLSHEQDGSDGTWQPVPETYQWRWRFAGPRKVYVRFRDQAGAETQPLVLSPDFYHVYIPLLER